MTSPTLRAYQRAGIDFLASRSRAILADEPGLGKTCQALLAAKLAGLPLLVVCPPAVAIHWRREADLWLGPAQAARAVRVYGFYDKALVDLEADTFSTVVVDEVHWIKTPGSIRSKRACRLLARTGGRAWALSGTLVPNRPVELWPAMLALGLLPPEYQAWEAFTGQFCGPKETPWGVDVTGASNLPELRELLRPHVLRRTKAEIMPELPPKVWRVLALDLPLAHREKDLDRRELARLREPVAFEALSD
ncbi:MAG: SNF2-related protein, partial [Candidatus Rokubacteria bacterium]|nr:SNF2-related protein [Candidatus Rokubacteria bacterium]